MTSEDWFFVIFAGLVSGALGWAIGVAAFEAPLRGFCIGFLVNAIPGIYIRFSENLNKIKNENEELNNEIKKRSR